MLSRHKWSGNVRELENVIGHACMIVMGDIIDVVDLPEYLKNGSHSDSVPASPIVNETAPIADSLEANERILVAGAIERAQGNQSEAPLSAEDRP